PRRGPERRGAAFGLRHPAARDGSGAGLRGRRPARPAGVRAAMQAVAAEASEWSPVVNGLRIGQIVEIRGAGAGGDAALEGELGQLVNYLPEVDRLRVALISSGQRIQLEPAHVVSAGPCRGPGAGGGPESFDLVLGPRTSREAMAEGISDCLGQKGFCVLKVIQATEELAEAFEVLKDCEQRGELGRLAREVEEGYLGRSGRAKATWLDPDGDLMHPGGLLARSDANITALAEALQPRCGDCAGAPIEDRTPSLACLSMSDMDEADYEHPIATDQVIYEFYSTWVRSVLRVIHFLGPARGMAELTVKPGAPTTLGLDPSLEVAASAGTILIFREDTFEYSYEEPEEGEACWLQAFLMKPAARWALGELRGDALSLLRGPAGGPAPPPPDADNLVAVTALSIQACGRMTDHHKEWAAYFAGCDGHLEMPVARFDYLPFYSELEDDVEGTTYVRHFSVQVEIPGLRQTPAGAPVPDLQRKLEDIDDETLCSERGVDVILERLDRMSGERRGDERRKVARECLLDYSRRHNENRAEYCARIDAAFDRVASQGLALSDDWKLMFLEEGVGLDDKLAQLAKISTRGERAYKAALAAIMEMDISHREHLSSKRRTFVTMEPNSHAYTPKGAAPPPPTPPMSWPVEAGCDDESLLDYSDVSSMNSEGEMAVWAVLETADAGEDDAPAALAAINQERRKTWKDNKDLKRRLKVGRKFFDRSGARGTDGREKPRSSGRRAANCTFRPRGNRLPLAELIKRTWCRLCHESGHWSKGPPNMPGSSAPRAARPPKGGSHFSGLSFMCVNALDGYGAGASEGSASLQPPAYAVVLLSVGLGAMVVDAAAGQGLMGQPALEKIERRRASKEFAIPKEGRPTAVAERLTNEKDQAWVYGATGSHVLEGLNKSQSGVADSAASAVANLQRGEAFMKDVKTAQRRAVSAKRKVEKDNNEMEVESLAQHDLAAQAKMARDVQAKFQQRFDGMTEVLKGVAMNQLTQGEALARVNHAGSEQITALATIRGEAQSASCLARSLQDAASGKAGLSPPRADQGAAAQAGPSLTDEPKSPAAPATSSPAAPTTGPSPQPPSRMAAGPIPAGATWAHVGAAPLDPTKLPPAIARGVQEQKEVSRAEGAPVPCAAPSLGRCPTCPSVAATQQMNPQFLLDAQGGPIQDSLETVSSCEIPPMGPLIVAAPQRPCDRSKGKAKGSEDLRLPGQVALSGPSSQELRVRKLSVGSGFQFSVRAPGKPELRRTGAEGEGGAEGGEVTGAPGAEHEVEITAPIKRLIHKVRVNLGHGRGLLCAAVRYSGPGAAGAVSYNEQDEADRTRIYRIVDSEDRIEGFGQAEEGVMVCCVCSRFCLKCWTSPRRSVVERGVQGPEMVDHLRSTASLPVVMRRFDPKRFFFATASDCGGVGPDVHLALLQDGIELFDNREHGQERNEEGGSKNDEVEDHCGAEKGSVRDAERTSVFEISNKEASCMDPQCRQVLEVGYLSIHQLGITKKDCNVKPLHASVSVGLDKQEWMMMTSTGEAPSSIGTNNQLAITANRFNYVFNLKGGSFVCDTACSSSLVAAHLGKVNLLERRWDPLEWHLGCGTALTLTVHSFVHSCAARMLSQGGRCFTFDRSADGYNRGDGTAALVLQAGALEERRLVLFRGSQMGQDGRSAGMSAPNGPAQEKCVLGAMREARMTPPEATVWECHGTGTALGDPIEVGAVRKVQTREKRLETLLVATSKSNFGHLEGSAAAISMNKCILVVLRNSCPATQHLRVLNAHLNTDFDAHFVTEMTTYSHTQTNCHVSSFGVGGTNGHAIFWGEAYSPPVDVQSALTSKMLSAVAPIIVNGSDPAAWEYSGPPFHAAPDEEYRVVFTRDPVTGRDDVRYERVHREELRPPEFYALAGNHNGWAAERMLDGRGEQIAGTDGADGDSTDEDMGAGHASAQSIAPALDGSGAGCDLDERDAAARRWLASRSFFAVVGAMKSGTCALRYHLRASTWEDNSCIPAQELHFFDDDEEFRKGAAHYRSWFEWDKRWPPPDVVGDVTPSYLYIPEALPRLRQLMLVAILRNPVERFASQPGSSKWGTRLSASRRAGLELGGIFSATSQCNTNSSTSQCNIAGNHGQSPFSQCNIAVQHRSATSQCNIAGNIAVQHEQFNIAARADRAPSRSDAFARGLYGSQLRRLLDLFPRGQLLAVVSERYRSTSAMSTGFWSRGHPSPVSATQCMCGVRLIAHSAPESMLVEMDYRTARQWLAATCGESATLLVFETTDTLLHEGATQAEVLVITYTGSKPTACMLHYIAEKQQSPHILRPKQGLQTMTNQSKKLLRHSDVQRQVLSKADKAPGGKVQRGLRLLAAAEIMANLKKYGATQTDVDRGFPEDGQDAQVYNGGSDNVCEEEGEVVPAYADALGMISTCIAAENIEIAKQKTSKWKKRLECGSVKIDDAIVQSGGASGALWSPLPQLRRIRAFLGLDPDASGWDSASPLPESHVRGPYAEELPEADRARLRALYAQEVADLRALLADALPGDGLPAPRAWCALVLLEMQLATQLH
ncbi:unnamed protein product, partial [Prorocentrum cordatum]